MGTSLPHASTGGRKSIGRAWRNSLLLAASFASSSRSTTHCCFLAYVGGSLSPVCLRRCSMRMEHLTLSNNLIFTAVHLMHFQLESAKVYLFVFWNLCLDIMYKSHSELVL